MPPRRHFTCCPVIPDGFSNSCLWLPRFCRALAHHGLPETSHPEVVMPFTKVSQPGTSWDSFQALSNRSSPKKSFPGVALCLVKKIDLHFPLFIGFARRHFAVAS
jgi:hypothetical protein